MRLAVLGDPLAFTRSPDLHRAAGEALGIAVESLPLRTAPAALAEQLEWLEREGFAGCNLTLPLKQTVLPMLDSLSPLARAARSVNTVTFAAGARRGDTTDGPGFLDLLEERRFSPTGRAVVLLGAGGASRSLAVALATVGARLAVSARRTSAARGAWSAVAEAAFVDWRSTEESEALAGADVVVNATPLRDDIAPWEALGPHALLVDLAYGAEPTPWVREARERGFAAIDGLGLLVHQARRSLSGWFGQPVPLEPLARAVGWPR